MKNRFSSRSTRVWLAVLATLAMMTTALVSPAAAKPNRPNPPGQPDPPGQLIDLQLLGFNDYHGHLEASTPGTVASVPAGGAEYLSAKLNELRQGNKYSLTVAAGDLIGGSPAFSGLFHDEPSVESLNAMELDVSGVGNHEFDEGVTELLRMQNGGCHPVDGCYFPNDPFSGADFQWLAANVVDEDRRHATAALLDRTGQERQGRLHRHDARGHRHACRRRRHPGI